MSYSYRYITFSASFLYPISNIPLNTWYRKSYHTIHILWHIISISIHKHFTHINIYDTCRTTVTVNIKYNHTDGKAIYLISLGWCPQFILKKVRFVLCIKVNLYEHDINFNHFSKFYNALVLDFMGILHE